MSFRITHCICFDISFARLKEIADREQCKTIEELQEKADFGLNCGLCVPYVREMLKTGETEFSRIISDKS